MSAGIHLAKVQRKDSFLSATNFCANLEPRTRRGARAYSPLRSGVVLLYKLGATTPAPLVVEHALD